MQMFSLQIHYLIFWDKWISCKVDWTWYQYWELFHMIVIEEDKNKARRAWSDGLDGSISMGQRKGKPILCMGPLQIEHYIK